MTNSAFINSLADRLADEFVTADGKPASHDHVVNVVDAAAKPLVDAPLQQFVPLLVENAARNQLHGEGMHRATS